MKQFAHAPRIFCVFYFLGYLLILFCDFISGSDDGGNVQRKTNGESRQCRLEATARERGREKRGGFRERGGQRKRGDLDQE